ncbi:hypothetical protein Pcinc_021745 [Petrolisthes cinctipes]|uniref:Uncharacterized protein n=1 Tax=Petrolisthes cinctipes TaxID=88211 RepID=A0AAE1KH10_PETCI|nr:hypothetical protein Pcinc_021745 [Petrolisthes cinctipes]
MSTTTILLAAAVVGLVLCINLTEALVVGDQTLENVSYGDNNPLHLLVGNAIGSQQQLLPHSRKKRAYQFPEGSNLEVKWGLNFPYNTYTLYHSKAVFAIPIKFPFPPELTFGPTGIQELQERFGQGSEAEIQWLTRKKRAARQERLHLFNYVQILLDKAGVDGGQCLLRAICDVGEAPLDQGLFGEMLNIMLSASPAGRPESNEDSEYEKFIEAELHGRLNGGCETRYSKCKISPFDLVPQLISRFMEE